MTSNAKLIEMPQKLRHVVSFRHIVYRLFVDVPWLRLKGTVREDETRFSVTDLCDLQMIDIVTHL